MKLTDAEFVMLDTETCHFDDPQVIELAGLRWKYQRTVEFSDFKETFVDPQRKIDPASRAVHHISDADIEGAPLLSDIGQEWSEWCGSRVIVAYNADFDKKALRNTPLADHPWLDAYRAAMHVWSLGMENKDGFALKSLQQQELRYWLDVPSVMGDAHRAAADIQVTGHIFSQIVERYLECGQPDDLQAFMDYINGPILHDTIPIGGMPYRGKRPEEVVDWALKKAFDSSSDMYPVFEKFNVLDCLRPEFIRRFGHAPQTKTTEKGLKGNSTDPSSSASFASKGSSSVEPKTYYKKPTPPHADAPAPTGTRWKR